MFTYRNRWLSGYFMSPGDPTGGKVDPDPEPEPDPTPDPEPDPEDDPDPEPEPEPDPVAKLKEEFDAELAKRDARIEELVGRLEKPEPKAEPRDDGDAPEIPDYYALAITEAQKAGYKGFFDSDGEPTDKGAAWMNSRALQLAAADQLRSTEDARSTAAREAARKELEEAKPQVVKAMSTNIRELYTDLPEGEEEKVASDYVDLCVSQGLTAADLQTDDGKKQGRINELVALGLAFERTLKGKEEPEPKKAHKENVSGASGGQELKLSEKDKRWLKNWEARNNGGKVADKKQIAKLRDAGYIGGSA